MSKKATLLLPTGASTNLEDFELTLGELIVIARRTLDQSIISSEGFGALKHFFFVNSSTGSLIDSILDLRRPLSTLSINDGDVIELRLCKPDPQADGTILNPMYGVTKFVN